MQAKPADIRTSIILIQPINDAGARIGTDITNDLTGWDISASIAYFYIGLSVYSDFINFV